MAKVFVDTNYFIGLANMTPETETTEINNHQAFVSVLSCHVLFYVNKIKSPNKATNSFISEFNLVNFGQKTLAKSLLGPTKDLEDNIQLHSSQKLECEYFLTLDKDLLKMKRFKKTKIVNHL